MNAYLTLARQGSFEETISRSRFLSAAFPVKDEEEALALLRGQKEQWPDARHHCWCYIIGENGERTRYSDDGEPSGTGGLPILNCLTSRGLTNALVVVTRYFGGILLGTGGLTRAYGSGAAGAVAAAGTVQMLPGKQFLLEADYAAFARLEAQLRRRPYVRIGKTEYGASASAVLLVAAGDAARLQTELAALTAGQCALKELGDVHFAKEGNS